MVIGFFFNGSQVTILHGLVIYGLCIHFTVLAKYLLYLNIAVFGVEMEFMVIGFMFQRLFSWAVFTFLLPFAFLFTSPRHELAHAHGLGKATAFGWPC